MRHSLNFDKTLPYLTALTPMKLRFFWFYLIPSQRYSSQTFMWFCIVNTPVTLVSTFMKTVGWKMSVIMTHRNQVNQFANASKF